MGLYTTAAGIDATLTSTTQQAPLGQLLVEPAIMSGTRANQGPRVWVYVLNAEAATNFVQGTIISRDLGAATYAGNVAPLNAPSAAVMGVAQHLLAFGSYGFIQKLGIGEVLADTGGITADNALVVGNAVAGRADNAGAGVHAFGVSTETVLATALATCWINAPG